MITLLGELMIYDSKENNGSAVDAHVGIGAEFGSRYR